MSCILMHSDHDAFIRIILHKFVFQFTTAELPDLWMRENAQNALKCTKMHTNAHKCKQMRRTRGPHIHTQETPSGLKARLTWKHGPDGLWTGCDRVPM